MTKVSIVSVINNEKFDVKNIISVQQKLYLFPYNFEYIFVAKNQKIESALLGKIESKFDDEKSKKFDSKIDENFAEKVDGKIIIEDSKFLTTMQNAGLKKCSGKCVILLDFSNSNCVEIVKMFLQKIEEGYDFVKIREEMPTNFFSKVKNFFSKIHRSITKFSLSIFKVKPRSYCSEKNMSFRDYLLPLFTEKFGGYFRNYDALIGAKTFTIICKYKKIINGNIILQNQNFEKENQNNKIINDDNIKINNIDLKLNNQNDSGNFIAHFEAKHRANTHYKKSLIFDKNMLYVLIFTFFIAILTVFDVFLLKFAINASGYLAGFVLINTCAFLLSFCVLYLLISDHIFYKNTSIHIFKIN